MPIKCLFPLENNQMDHTLVHVLSIQIANLEKLEQSHQVAMEMAMKR
jgi:hypothetical protein